MNVKTVVIKQIKPRYGLGICLIKTKKKRDARIFLFGGDGYNKYFNDAYIIYIKNINKLIGIKKKSESISLNNNIELFIGCCKL